VPPAARLFIGCRRRLLKLEMNQIPDISSGDARRYRLHECVMANRAHVPRIAAPPDILDPQEPVWNRAARLAIDQFRPEGSPHRPQTSLQLLHDNHAIHGLFRVQDQYVRCTHAQYGDHVYRDSCVEFFIKPKPDSGYFNFEFNCGGAFLCCYITDETRIKGGFKEYIKLSADDVRRARVATSLPKLVEPEIVQPVTWWLAFTIPILVVEKFVGLVGPLSGQVWRANAYKCGNETSHPHWAAWSPVDQLNFHLPRCFGALEFE
jgi:hypothetical protein